MTQHVPSTARFKRTIKDALYSHLYSPVQRKATKRIKELVVANSKALASSQTGFMYKGTWYTFEPDKPEPRRKNRLVPSLKEAMDKHLADTHKLNSYEIPYVMGFVTNTLNSSDAPADYLRVLPEPLHPALRELGDPANMGPGTLSDDEVSALQARNQIPIELIKSRLVLNLLLQ